MSNYRICDFCGNLYEKRNISMCKDCESNYMQIRSIVEKRPDMMVLEISNETGISVSKILSFVKDGYFVLKESSLEAAKLGG